MLLSMKYLREVCAIPTAPFLEDRVVDYVNAFVAGRPRLRISADRHGNRLIVLPGRGRCRGRWVFVAHMDHPGLEAARTVRGNLLEAAFRGYVLAGYMRGAPVRFFDGDREIPGRVKRVVSEDGTGRARTLLVEVSGDVPRGCAGMFDFPPATVRNGLFHSRACDDLAGVAACLEMLDRLHAKPPQATVAVLLTRAEEGGLVGAMAASIRPSLLRRSDRIVSLETSAMQPHAPVGGGPIIRVGDRWSVFDSGLTYFLTETAEAMRSERRGFRCQRALMPGGICEATVFDAWGFRACAMCVALGNYHNMDRQRNRLGPEYISASDWRMLVDLCEEVARRAHTFRDNHASLRRRLRRRYDALKIDLRRYPIAARRGV